MSDDTPVARGTILAAAEGSAAPCGCRKMSIRFRHRAHSEVYCPENPRHFERIPGCRRVASDVCPDGSYSFQCALGANSPVGPIVTPGRLGWNFEVRAELVPEAEPGTCEQGQLLRASFNAIRDRSRSPHLRARKHPVGPLRLGDRTYQVSNSRMPRLEDEDPAFGADGYQNPDNPFVVWRDGDVRWFDAPNVGQVGTHSFEQGARFVSYVTGDAGRCWCEFSLSQDYKNGQRTGPGFTLNDGEHCFLQAPVGAN